MSRIFTDFNIEYRLQTARLELRPPCPDDLSSLWPLVADPRLSQFLAWEPHANKEDTICMINSLLEAQKDGKGFHWVVIHEKIIVGLVSLIDVRRNHRAWTLNRAELAYWVAPAAQSRGYATEAAWAVMNFAFGRLAFHKLIVYHAADNPSSAHVVKKLGFRHVGNEREAFCKHGIWHDLSHYELLESEYYANNHI